MPKKYTIALDDGHGLETPGKRTPKFPDGTVMKENEFNRRVVYYLKQELERCGFNVVLVAPEDTDVPLSVRCRRANEAKADLYVSVHANANTGQWGNWGGIETFTWSKGDSLRIGKLIHEELMKGTPMVDRGVKDGSWLYVLKNTSMPAVLVELGFMDSRHDAPYLLKESYRKECAQEIARGICRGFNVPYVPEKPQKDTPAETKTTKRYRLVTGTFANYSDAQEAAAWLRKTKGWIIHVGNVAEGRFRLYTGTFGNLDDAKAAKDWLQKTKNWLVYIEEAI